MQIAKYLGLIEEGEGVLAEAFTVVSNRHDREPDIRDMSRQMANWSHAHINAVQHSITRFGREPVDASKRISAALFQGTRSGGIGLLQDLEDLAVLTHYVHTKWLVLSVPAGSLQDKELEGIASGCMGETERQLAWLQTQVKHVAVQATIVSPD